MDYPAGLYGFNLTAEQKIASGLIHDRRVLHLKSDHTYVMFIRGRQWTMPPETGTWKHRGKQVILSAHVFGPPDESKECVLSKDGKTFTYNGPSETEIYRR